MVWLRHCIVRPWDEENPKEKANDGSVCKAENVLSSDTRIRP